MKRLIGALAAVLLLAGCGGSGMDAAQAVQAIYDLYVHGEPEGVERLGMAPEQTRGVLDRLEAVYRGELEAVFAEAGLTPEEEDIGRIAAAWADCCKRLTAECAVISRKGARATVSLRTTAIDAAALDGDAARRTLAQMQAADGDDAGESGGQARLEELYRLYTQNLIGAYGAATPSAGTQEIAVECVLTGGEWFPASPETFAQDLFEAIQGK